MKKLLLLAAALMMSMCAWAQYEPTSDNDDVPADIKRPFTISLGAKAGVNYSFAGNPDGMDMGMKGNVGFQGGLAFNIHFSDKKEYTPSGTGRFGIQLEAMYAQRSLKTDIENIKLNCFSVPLLFQFYVTPSFAIEVGPTFTGVLSTSPKTMNYNNNIMGLEKIKGYDVMVTAGVDYYHKSGFTASARYNMGNSHLAKNFKTKVSSAELSVGYLFTIYK